jgi:ABC-2 type transport system ATP-binding protein
MTTHILEVAERMADRIGVIAHGRLLAEGTLAELRRLAAASGGARAGTSESAGDLASLEDTFLALVADAAVPAEAA